ncbi:MAG: DUF2155 domain-containing protein [Proteobacteria bacterium]|nr:DUF2155 domain-containing protein [Pseudomonadota bacterium]
MRHALSLIPLSRLALAIGMAGLAVPAFADKFKHPTAIFAGLDKITGRIISFEAAIDETVQFGSLQLTARVCYTRAEDSNPRTTTFIEVDEVGGDNQYKKIFSGWMIAQSPGLNAIEHPVYDVWLTDCKGAKEADRIKTSPEVDEDDEPPAPIDAKKPPRPAIAQPGPRGTGAPLRLPDGAGAPVPPTAIPPRAAPQQRFFPTNSGPGRSVNDPSGGGNR